MNGMNTLEILFVLSAFTFQALLIVHFALRKWYFDLAIRFGWILYMLSIPAAILSLFLLIAHEPWYLWISGFLYLVWGIFGYWIEYVREIEWRNSLRWPILIPYISLYLATVMFYWWPLALIYKPLWYLYAVLFIASTVLNVTSHKGKESTLAQGTLR